MTTVGYPPLANHLRAQALIKCTGWICRKNVEAERAYAVGEHRMRRSRHQRTSGSSSLADREHIEGMQMPVMWGQPRAGRVVVWSDTRKADRVGLVECQKREPAVVLAELLAPAGNIGLNTRINDLVGQESTICLLPRKRVNSGDNLSVCH